MKKTNPISMRSGQIEFFKVNIQAQRWRDVYHWVLSLMWPRFAALAAFISESTSSLQRSIALAAIASPE
jgi:hypothetical protein